MIATEKLKRSFSALESGLATDQFLGQRDSAAAEFEPVDLVLLDVSGWRGLATGMGWDRARLRSFDDLVDRWLVGGDRRELLDMAMSQAESGSGSVDFEDLAAGWLDQNRLGRLVALINESGYELPMYPLCYSLRKAFTVVDIAIEHVNARSSATAEELRLVPADDALGFDTGDVRQDFVL